MTEGVRPKRVQAGAPSNPGRYHLAAAGPVLLGGLTGLLAILAVLSLKWRAVQDAPIMMYLAYLMDQLHYVPYRDFFDLNPPGTFFINIAVGRCFGYTDLGLRCGDVTFLLLLLAVTYAWLRTLGWKVAWCGTVLFGLVYLGHGPYMSMQREYLLLLPLALTVLAAARISATRPFARVGLSSALFGLALAIRPQAAVLFPWFLGVVLWDQRKRGAARGRAHILWLVAASAAACAAPVLLVCAYLAARGGLVPFLDIAFHYWRLHGSLTGDHVAISGAARVNYLLTRSLSLGSYGVWLAPAAMGAYVALFRSTLTPRDKHTVVLHAGLVMACAIYPALSGQFWEYHWLPFGYFLVTMSALCLVSQPETRGRAERSVPVLLLSLVIFVGLLGPGQWTNTARYLHSVGKSEPVDEIAGFLEANLRPRDTVQPLDWTQAAVHAMLLARARIATPFVYDYHFYHHVSHPYVQKLRARFLHALRTVCPRFIVEVQPGVPRVTGEDTDMRFPELHVHIKAHYREVASGPWYRIYERRH
jgi:hypothetical protein